MTWWVNILYEYSDKKIIYIFFVSRKVCVTKILRIKLGTSFKKIYFISVWIKCILSYLNLDIFLFRYLNFIWTKSLTKANRCPSMTFKKSFATENVDVRKHLSKLWSWKTYSKKTLVVNIVKLIIVHWNILTLF